MYEDVHSFMELRVPLPGESGTSHIVMSQPANVSYKPDKLLHPLGSIVHVTVRKVTIQR